MYIYICITYIVSPFICLPFWLPIWLVVSGSLDAFSLLSLLSHHLSLAILPIYLSPNYFVSNHRSALVVVSGSFACSLLCVCHHFSPTTCLLLDLSPKSFVSNHMSALVAVSCSSLIMFSFVFRVCLCCSNPFVPSCCLKINHVAPGFYIMRFITCLPLVSLFLLLSQTQMAWQKIETAWHETHAFLN